MKTTRKELTYAALGVFAMGWYVPAFAADAEPQDLSSTELTFTPDPQDCRTVTKPSTRKVEVGKGVIIFHAPAGCVFVELSSSTPGGPSPLVIDSNKKAVTITKINDGAFSVEYDFPTEDVCYDYSFLLKNDKGPNPYGNYICSR